MDEVVEPVTVVEPPPVEPEPAGRIGQTSVVILAVITAIVVVSVALIVKGAVEQAESLSTCSIVIGAGLAIGFRKRWAR